MTNDRANADRAVHAAVTALQGLTASIDKAWDEAIGKRQPPPEPRELGPGERLVDGEILYSSPWLNQVEGHQLESLTEREENAAEALPRKGQAAGGPNWRGNSDRPSRSVSVFTDRGGEPEATSPVSAPVPGEAPSPSVIRDLTEDLSFTHDELRDLWKEPPSVSRARRYEAMGIVHEQAARLCRKLAGAWEVEEGRA